MLEGLQCHNDELDQKICLVNQQVFSFESNASNYHLLIDMIFQECYSKYSKTKSITNSSISHCLNQREEGFSESLKTEKLHPTNFGEK